MLQSLSIEIFVWNTRDGKECQLEVSWKAFVSPFHATGLFLYPPKTSENLWFSDVFRVIERGSRYDVS